MIEEVRVIMEDLPTKIKGFVYTDGAYNPCIVINSRMPVEIQRETYAHEIDHILRGDMDNKDYREYSA